MEAAILRRQLVVDPNILCHMHRVYFSVVANLCICRLCTVFSPSADQHRLNSARQDCETKETHVDQNHPFEAFKFGFFKGSLVQFGLAGLAAFLTVAWSLSAGFKVAEKPNPGLRAGFLEGLLPARHRSQGSGLGAVKGLGQGFEGVQSGTFATTWGLLPCFGLPG